VAAKRGGRAGLLNHVASQMLVRLRELRQFRFVVEFRFGHVEATDAIGRVGLDVGDAVDFLQGASDRGGAAPSRHVGHFESHQFEFGR